MTADPTYVTRIALATGQGTSTDAVWEAVLAGRSGYSEVEDGTGRTLVYGDLDTTKMAIALTGRTKVQTDPLTQAALAMSDALLDGDGQGMPGPRNTIGVQLGNNYGGLSFAQTQLANLRNKGPAAVSPYQSFAWFYSVNTGQIAIRHKLTGPSGTVATEACGGIDAIGVAQHELRGGMNSMITGAVDGTRSPFGIASIASSVDAFAPGIGPEHFAPYSTRTRGFIPGAGGALILLQSAAATPPSRRDVELVACASGFQAGSEGNVLCALVRHLLEHHGVRACDIGVVFSDAAGVPTADESERAALLDVFAADQPPVTAPKTGFGRLFAGTSAVDLALATLTLRSGQIPPFARSYGLPDPGEPLDLVYAGSRPLEQDHALVLSTGFGGYRSAALLRRVG